MRNFNLSGYFAKGLMIISGVAVFALALIGSFYLLVAGIVIALTASLIAAARGKPQRVRVRTHQRPLEGEYRVIRRR